MLDFTELNRRIALPDEAAAALAEAHWDSIAKPLKGLGELETMVTGIAALTGTPRVCLGKQAVVVFCADNGVVAEGVTQTDASVTATMAGQIRDHRSSVCRMAAAADAEVFPVDMGMLHPVEGVEGCHIADGTGNIALGPAMTREQACLGISYGIRLVKKYADLGYGLLATGEMGIGNTTSSAAVACVLLGLPAKTVTGRGAGLSDEGLRRKQEVIERAIAANRPNPKDALDVLAKLGGFDIAGMTGLFLGGALYRVPILMDGLISSVAALIATRLCPRCRCALFASHTSAEPAADRILKELGLRAVLHAHMKLGEGTGAVCMIPLLRMALAVYNSSAAFTDIGVLQYQKLEGEEP
ncbi:MAG: nicotinate-nucleotide--dimethylbenzimidazole phosphoribosyltransferase [Lachnospiraceae bacterium]|nr:nicotinate-nucleotide--dimethylbenzimidazole phosphoribosyltransferase [Lachnospiraceae bacterium]